MATLKVQKRDMAVKAKKLRREGFTTAILLRADAKDSLPLQIETREASNFIRANKDGSQVTLVMGRKKISALVKAIDYNAMEKQILTMDFQELVEGHKIASVAQIRLVNKDHVEGFIESELTEIHYKADPDHLIETVDVDFDKIGNAKSVYVKDLPMADDPDISLITPADALIVHIADHLKNGYVEEPANEEAEIEPDAEKVEK